MREHADLACEHANGDRCAIADKIGGGTSYRLTPAACAACLKSDALKGINSVTVSLAASGLREAGKQEESTALMRQHRDLLTGIAAKLSEVLPDHGVGSAAWRLIESLGMKHWAGCDCLKTAKMWNEWGVAGCLAARSDMVSHLRKNAKRFGFGAVVRAAVGAVATGAVFTWMNPLDPYGSIVDEAIRITEEHERENDNRT